MIHIRTAAFALFAAAALAVTGCASETAEPADDTGSSSSDTTEEQSNGDGDVSVGAGSAIVTVNGQTWEYASYLCATGYENTSSDVYSFSSTSFTTVDGETIQVLVDVRDETGEDRVSGEGVVYEITVFDTENGTVDIQTSSTEDVTITDTTVSAEGTFTDFDGVDHSIKIEATCG